jgi:hypothetical protein
LGRRENRQSSQAAKSTAMATTAINAGSIGIKASYGLASSRRLNGGRPRFPVDGVRFRQSVGDAPDLSRERWRAF